MSKTGVFCPHGLSKELPFVTNWIWVPPPDEGWVVAVALFCSAIVNVL